MLLNIIFQMTIQYSSRFIISNCYCHENPSFKISCSFTMFKCAALILPPGGGYCSGSFKPPGAILRKKM